MTKRTKSKKSDLSEAPPVVTHVVEVVDDATGESLPIEDSVKKVEIKEVVDELKDEVEDVQEKVGELEDKVQLEDNPPVSHEETRKEAEKEVIGEIFGDKETGVMPEISGSTKGPEKSLIVWACIVIGVALLTGLGLLMIVRGPSTVTSLFVKPTPTPTPSPVSTPTPTPVLSDRSQLTIEVLNGSGKAGAAAKMQDFLKGKGYTVKKVGNAETSDFDKTQIHVKKDKEAFLGLLKTDVGEGYTVSSPAADLSDNSSYDAQVIVGKE